MSTKKKTATNFTPQSRRDEVRKEILSFCKTGFKTMEQISRHLGLSINTVRAYYVYPMVEYGDLQLLLPDRRRSHHQAFKAS